MPSVLFVCTANRCRSPMAAALFAKLIGQGRRRGDCRVDSAGTWAAEGTPATPFARQVMRERGLDLSGHRSKRISGELLRESDLVLVMEDGHREALSIEFPESAGRIHVLSTLAGERYSLFDPEDGTLESHRILADELTDLLQRGLPRIHLLLAQAGAGAEGACRAG